MSTENENVVTIYDKEGVTVYSPQEIEFLERMKTELKDYPQKRVENHCSSCIDGVCVGFAGNDERFKGTHIGCIKSEVLLYHLLIELAEFGPDEYPVITCIPFEQEVHIMRVFVTLEEIEGEIGGTHYSSALFFQYRELVPGKREFISAWLMPQDDNLGRAHYYPSRLDMRTLTKILKGDS